MTRYALARRPVGPGLSVDQAAAAAGLHPHMITGLNYSAVGVVLDLLDRIEELEAALRARPNGYRR